MLLLYDDDDDDDNNNSSYIIYESVGDDRNEMKIPQMIS